MAQELISFNGVVVKQPDEYTPSMATTSTEDSGRDMSLMMINTPIGTVEAYNLKWSNIPLAEASKILRQVINRNSFVAHYCSIYDGRWQDREFYASNYSASAKTLKDGVECWKELSFQITGVYPV